MSTTRPVPNFLKVTKGDGKGIIIGLIPKSGFTSIWHSLLPGSAVKVPPQQMLDEQLPVRIYIRDPLKRFISAFRYLSSIAPTGLHKELELPLGYGLREFTDRVLDRTRKGDTHWMPQLPRFDSYNLAEIYRFEDIDDTWPGPAPLKHLKSTPNSVPVPELRHRIRHLSKYYVRDTFIWTALTERDA